jgi:hypothetical protein
MKQPKYITYKGAKYQKIDTLSEIVVQPHANCCVITTLVSRGHMEVDTQFEAGNPKRIAEDFLSRAKQGRDGYIHYPEEFFSKEPIEIDRYSYYADIGADGEFLAVCTKGKGKWSFLYDLAENDDYDGITDAASEREDMRPRHGLF